MMPQKTPSSLYRIHAPVHPTITSEQVSLLVERFYERVRKDPELGQIFEANISMSWDQHLSKMKSFWRSVLLKTGEYSGKPVPVHQKIVEITDDRFNEWLSLFSETTAEIFTPDAVPLVNEIAQRIATSLWLSRTNDPYASPPVWAANQQ